MIRKDEVFVSGIPPSRSVGVLMEKHLGKIVLGAFVAGAFVFMFGLALGPMMWGTEQKRFEPLAIVELVQTDRTVYTAPLSLSQAWKHALYYQGQGTYASIQLILESHPEFSMPRRSWDLPGGTVVGPAMLWQY